MTGSAANGIREPEAVTKLLEYYGRVAPNLQGLPMYNPALEIEGVGFREHLGRWAGVVVTPWFMNLTVLPSATDVGSWCPGQSARLAFPSGLYEFSVSQAGTNGMVATRSLFPLMHDFSDPASARAAARAAADALFEPEPPERPAAAKSERVISRRKLFGG